MKSDKARLAGYLILVLVLGYICYRSIAIFFVNLEVTLLEASVLLVAILATWWLLYVNIKKAFTIWVKLTKARQDSNREMNG